MFDKRLVKNIDYGLIAALLLICIFGLVMVYSSTYKTSSTPYGLLIKQASWFLLSVFVFITILFIDYRELKRFYWLIYIGNILFLASVFVLGKRVSGAQSWISLGSLGNLQPSEFSKIATIITLACLMDKREDMTNPANLIAAFAHLSVPLVLILLQPDFGTAMVYVGMIFGMLYVAGAKAKHLLGMMGVGIASLPLLFKYFLKEYQRKRLLIFLNPEMDPTGAGHNILQSKIAIGSGRLFGKGLFSSSQAQLNFLPEHHTDFIFSVIGEEIGFIGVLALLAVYFYILWRIIKTVNDAQDKFGSLIAAGVASILLVHIIVNVGMTLGMMPVTGIPLPFISYGGSSLLTNMIGMALVTNIYMRRKKLMF